MKKTGKRREKIMVILTGHYNSYLGFSPETGTAVVVLSNLSPNDRIPATVLGVKRLLELRR